MIRNGLRKATGYAFATAVLSASAIATGGTAQAADGSVDAKGKEYAGCPSGAVCIYPQGNWNGGKPEHIYYSYGGHDLYNEYGTHRVFNNQHSGATVSACTGSGGSNCGKGMGPWKYRDVNLTPVNSIKLSR